MATITRTPSGKWKALIRKFQYPTESKTFRIKRDAVEWATKVEDQMNNHSYIRRTGSKRTSIAQSLHRYLNEASIEKKPTSQKRDKTSTNTLHKYLGRYSLAALTQEVIASFRDERLEEGKSNNTVRLELALFVVNILKEADAGLKVEELCRKHGNSNATYYNWKSKYGGMEALELKKLKELQDETSKLKKCLLIEV